MQHSVGRAKNSAQSCEDGIVAITAAVLPRCTSIEIFCIKNWQALLSPVCSTTREPICRTTKRALEPPVPKVSTQRGEKWKLEARVEYFLILDASAELASLLAPLDDEFHKYFCSQIFLSPLLLARFCLSSHSFTVLDFHLQVRLVPFSYVLCGGFSFVTSNRYLKYIPKDFHHA